MEATQTSPLIAQAEGTIPQATEHTTATPDTAAAHNAHAEEGSSGKIFVELLEHVGDHHALHLDPIATIPLPYLFWDQQGFHMYGSEHAVEESETYTVNEKGAAMRKDGKPISFDMSITSNVFFMFLSGLVLFLVVKTAANKSRKSLVPSGLRNLVEVLIVFVRDEVVYPNVEKKYADKLMPYFLSIFFFIMTMNLIGLVPFGHTATGAVSVTAALAICTFLVTQIVGIRAMGFGNYLKHLTGGLLDMDIPLPIKSLLIVIMVPIEILGLFTKPFALAVRLFANMTAGHIVIVSLIGLAFVFHNVLVGAFVSVPFALFINLLELLVALLQAYVFTMLSAVFIGMMAHSEHEEHVEDHDIHHDEGNHLVPTVHAMP